MCAYLREEYPSVQQDVTEAKGLVEYWKSIHNLVDLVQQRFSLATGQTNVAIAAELAQHDPILEQARRTQRTDESQLTAMRGSFHVAKFYCPELVASLLGTGQGPSPQSATLPARRPIAGEWQAREELTRDAPIYLARINDIDSNGEYWGVVYRSQQNPTHFHGKFGQGATMAYTWYGPDGNGQGSLTYQDANHLTATWRDSLGKSRTWYFSR
jgi:hypothetical protein